MNESGRRLDGDELTLVGLGEYTYLWAIKSPSSIIA